MPTHVGDKTSKKMTKARCKNINKNASKGQLGRSRELWQFLSMLSAVGSILLRINGRIWLVAGRESCIKAT